MPRSLPSRCFLVLPAAGAGVRMGRELPKQYLPVLGIPVLQHTLSRLGTYERFNRIFLALSKADPHWPAVETALPAGLRNRITVIEGGQERAASVLNALHAMDTIAAPDDWVLVHDAVRPCVSRVDIELLLTGVGEHCTGGILANPVRETLKRTNAEGIIIETVDRHLLWQAATPQMFRYGILKAALSRCALEERSVTDEASAVEHWLASQKPDQVNRGIRVVQGRPDNIKVTYPEDLQLAEKLLGEAF